MVMGTYDEDLRALQPTRMQRYQALVRKQPSAILLGVQIFAILLIPFVEEREYGRVVISIMSVVALSAAVVTVRSTPAMTWLSLLLMAPAVVLEVWITVDQNAGPVLAAYAHGALAAFYFYTAYALVRYMFEDYWVTKDELFAVGAAFTVLLFAFAYLYLMIQEIWPGSFTAASGEGQRTFLELIYFSGANLTSVGLSDVLAIKPHARAVVTVEQLGGVMYVAMVISRLVALTVLRSRG